MSADNTRFRHREESSVQLSSTDAGQLLPAKPETETQISPAPDNTQIPLLVSGELIRSGRVKIVVASAIAVVASYITIFGMNLIFELFSKRAELGLDFDFSRPNNDALLAQIGSFFGLVTLFLCARFRISPPIMLLSSLLVSFLIPAINLTLLTPPSVRRIEPFAFCFYYGGSRGFIAAVVTIATLTFWLILMNRKSKEQAV